METTNEKDAAHSPVENRMISLRGQMFILDRDVANLYQVKTKHINQAVRNNPDKFPDGYVFELNDEENEQVKIFDQMSAKNMEIAEEEYSVEINLMAFKLSKTVKRIKK